MKEQSRKIALCGVLCGLAVVTLLLGGLLSVAVYCAPLLAMAVLLPVLLSQVFLVTQATGNEMFPAIEDGDLLIGYRLIARPVKNQVVLYRREGQLCAGRILAVAGDVVTLDESGTPLVNGAACGGDILYPTYPGDALHYPYTVPEDCVFVLGDYRTQSRDSREVGGVPLSDVQARVITLLRRRSI